MRSTAPSHLVYLERTKLTSCACRKLPQAFFPSDTLPSAHGLQVGGSWLNMIQATVPQRQSDQLPNESHAPQPISVFPSHWLTRLKKVRTSPSSRSQLTLKRWCTPSFRRSELFLHRHTGTFETKGVAHSKKRHKVLTLRQNSNSSALLTAAGVQAGSQVADVINTIDLMITVTLRYLLAEN